MQENTQFKSLTKQELSDFWGCSPSTVRRWVLKLFKNEKTSNLLPFTLDQYNSRKILPPVWCAALNKQLGF